MVKYAKEQPNLKKVIGGLLDKMAKQINKVREIKRKIGG